MALKVNLFSVWNIFLLAALFSLTLCAVDFVVDPGTGWHLATGQWILNHLKIPTTDPFLASPVLRPWIVEQWLADILLYFLYKTGGYELVFIVYQAIYLSIITFVFYPLLKSELQKSVLSILMILYAFKLGQVHFIMRPVFFSIIFFVLFYCCLLKIYKSFSGDEKFSFKNMPILFAGIITVLWVNIHPSFPLVFALSGLTALAILLDTKSLLRVVKAFVPFSLLLFLLTLCNPFGLAVYSSVFRVSGSTFAMNHYQEWQPPVWLNSEGIYFLFGALPIVIFVLFSKNYRKQIGFFHLLNFIFFVFLGFKALRFLPYFGFVAAIPLGILIKQLFARIFTVCPTTIKVASARIEQREFNNGSYKIVTGLLIAVLITIEILGVYPIHPRPSDKVFPFKAVDYLLEKKNESLIVFNDMSWGGFITFRGAGRLKAIVDDRTALLGDDFYEQYFLARQDKAKLQEFVKRYAVNYLMFDPQSDMGKLILSDRQNQIEYQDNVAALLRADNL